MKKDAFHAASRGNKKLFVSRIANNSNCGGNELNRFYQTLYIHSFNDVIKFVEKKGMLTYQMGNIFIKWYRRERKNRAPLPAVNKIVELLDYSEWNDTLVSIIATIYEDYKESYTIRDLMPPSYLQISQFTGRYCEIVGKLKEPTVDREKLIIDLLMWNITNDVPIDCVTKSFEYLISIHISEFPFINNTVTSIMLSDRLQLYPHSQSKPIFILAAIAQGKLQVLKYLLGEYMVCAFNHPETCIVMTSELIRKATDTHVNYLPEKIKIIVDEYILMGLDELNDITDNEALILPPKYVSMYYPEKFKKVYNRMDIKRRDTEWPLTASDELFIICELSKELFKAKLYDSHRYHDIIISH